MWKYPEELTLINKFGKYAQTAGILFMVLGAISAIFPVFGSYATVLIVSWLMLLTGLMAAYFTFMTDKSDWAGWLKSFVLMGVALYMLFSPLGGIATLGLLFSIYFFMDAFSAFMMASSQYPQKHWWMWLLNAILSLVMAMVFMIGWPFTSMYLIGILVGFSLFFDGLALLMGANTLKKMSDDE
jgi:uncharacterized membrane protein HdeD (DUF308 family)